MLILGIDPGYDRCGIAIIEKTPKNKDTVVFSECITTSSKDSIYDRFKYIGDEVTKILETYKPDALAIETLFVTKNQKTAMRVSEVRGIIIYQALKIGVPVFELSLIHISEPTRPY